MLGVVTNLYDFNSAKPQGTPAPSIDADAIRARLRAQALSFVRWLYRGRAFETPRTNPNEARIGNTYGEPGASLSISLRGESAGQWTDHATGQSGDLISLYAAFRGLDATRDFSRILRELSSEYFNEATPVGRPAWEPSAAAQIEERAKQLGTKPRADLIELGAPVATFPYYDMGGNIVASVVRYEPDGTRESKTFRPYSLRLVDGRPKWSQGTPDGLRPLFRLPQIVLEQTVVLCEGEGKAQALANLGVAATSAMQGANTPIDKTDWTPLYRKAVIIWPDNDTAGIEYANRVAAHLTHHGASVRLVAVPPGVRSKWDVADCIAEGPGDPHELIAQARPYEGRAEAARGRIRVLDIDDLEDLPAPSWLVEGILTQGGFSILWGPPGGLKSFVGVDLGMAVASGLAWHGKAIVRGLVLYVAAEGSHGLGKRAQGWRKTRGAEIEHPLFKIIPQSVALREEVAELIQTIRGLPQAPVLIIIDTLARTFGAGDENKQTDMNGYVSAADLLREATGAHVMVIHHSGVHDDKRERGSNALRGAADTVIKVSRKGHKLRLLNRAPEGKQKDAPEFDDILLTTAEIHFRDRRGIEHSTLILNADTDPDQPETDGNEAKNTARRASLGGNQNRVLKALKSSPEPLGWLRLRALTKIANDGSLGRTLNSLCERELIRRIGNGDETSSKWELA